jgi:hypothetical protein
MWLLVDTDNHRKNRSGLIRMCADEGVDLTISKDTAIFGNPWEVVCIPSGFISPSVFPLATKIVYGPHNFVFADGIWKRGASSFPANCVYNILSKWNVEVQEELGGVSMQMTCLPFPVDTGRFCPAPTVSKKRHCFVYFKHRHSSDLAAVLEAVQARGLSHTVLQYGSYSEEDFLNVVRESEFGIWVGSHESQGFALEEALSCDTPLLVWNSTTMLDEYVRDEQTYKDKSGVYALKATSHPYWDDTCGISFTDREDLGRCLDKMLQTQFHPRAFVENTLSSRACMKRFVSELGLVSTATPNHSPVLLRDGLC